jgi:hypothetical protein
MRLVLRDAGAGPAARTQVGTLIKTRLTRSRLAAAPLTHLGWLFPHHRLLQGTELARMCTTVSEPAVADATRKYECDVGVWQAQVH